MLKCLMITYYYPPMNAVGKNRTLRFERNLPFFGYKPIIHTVKNPDQYVTSVSHMKLDLNVNRSYALNFGMLTNFANGVLNFFCRIFRIQYQRNPFRQLLFYPDIHIGWIPFCVVNSIKLIKKEKIDIIYVSCSPFSASISGVLLKKITGKPLVLDFRDPWSFNAHNSKLFFSLKIHKMIEKWAVKNVDYLIVNTKTSTEIYRKLYPTIRNKISYIYNGYNSKTEIALQQKKEFVLLYTGAIYDYHYIKILFESLKKYKNKGNFALVFTGKTPKKVMELVAEYNLQKIVRFKGYVSQEKLHALYINANFLLFYNGFKNKNTLNTEVVKSKLFDYLETGLPILCIIPEGELTTLVKTYSPHSIVINNDFSLNLEKTIDELYSQWMNEPKMLLKKNSAFIKDFHESTLTKKLAKIFDTVISS